MRRSRAPSPVVEALFRPEPYFLFGTDHVSPKPLDISFLTFTGLDMGDMGPGI